MKYINNNIKHAKEKVYTRKCHARLGVAEMSGGGTP